MLSPSVALPAPPVPHPGYLHVSWGAGNDSVTCGLSAAAPCRTLQHAIDRAEDGATLYIAPGRYVGAGNRDLDLCVCVRERECVCVSV